MTAFLISGADVERLNSYSLPAVLNALLTAEANLRGVPLSGLNLTMRTTDPDAGVDGSIVWPKKTSHDHFRPGTIAVQYKAGKLKSGDIRTEFAKKGVRHTLKRASGQYVLFVGHEYAVATRTKHRRTLRDLCKRRGIKPSRCSILYADQIARWISRFPALAIGPEFGKAYPAFATVAQWRELRNLKNPFKLNQDRELVINQLRSFAQSASDENIFRVEGQAGVGKTRLVLEALKADGIAQRTLYCIDADGPPAQQLLAALQSEIQASAIVVLDECERSRQEELSPYAEFSGGRLRMVCIGPTEKLLGTTTPISGNLYQLRPLPQEEMESIIADAHPGAPQEIVNFAVRLSGGMPKLAIFITDTLEAIAQPSVRRS